MAPGRKSTRGWDDARQVTVLQREKEEAHDYRYFPDPDLVPVVVDDAWQRDVAARIPELPMHRRARYEKQYGLPAKDAAALTDERDVCLFFEACIEAYHALAASEVPIAHPGRAGAKLLLNAGARRANELGRGIHELGISPQQVAKIIELRDGEVIGSAAAEGLFGLLCETDEDAHAVAARHGLIQVRDEDQLARWCDEAVAAQPKAVEDYRQGKDAALGRLVGEVMKLSRGQADAKAVREKLADRLKN
jgi:aspartyl-tRNA(Asn)/glutamyl-tRNA(Gln) amidotransferase subunit B